VSGQSIPVSHRQDGPAGDRHRVAPPVDVFELADGILVVADLPGCTADALSIEVEDDTLAIEGTAAFAAPAGFHERLAENEPILYVRTFKLRPNLDRSRIKATLRDGVLTLEIPRTPETKARRIEVRTA
jgi:HSP20 family molecular chaperone IbpA